jgi:hypothetical protein
MVIEVSLATLQTVALYLMTPASRANSDAASKIMSRSIEAHSFGQKRRADGAKAG